MNIGSSEEVTVNEENYVVEAAGFTIELNPCIVNGDMTLSVAKATETPSMLDESDKVTAVNLQLGNLSEFTAPSMSVMDKFLFLRAGMRDNMIGNLRFASMIPPREMLLSGQTNLAPMVCPLFQSPESEPVETAPMEPSSCHVPTHDLQVSTGISTSSPIGKIPLWKSSRLFCLISLVAKTISQRRAT